VGALSLFAALVGVAGSVRIGTGVWMGGQVGVSNHLEIGDGARLAIATKLMRDVPAGETMSGHPARPHREQMKKQARLARLPRLVKRVEQLESAVEQLSGGGGARNAARLDP
jgi:UDP-3-O-[3-hydroxymyristoyl] glucosamine N-acyltransferase